MFVLLSRFCKAESGQVLASPDRPGVSFPRSCPPPIGPALSGLLRRSTQLYKRKPAADHVTNTRRAVSRGPRSTVRHIVAPARIKSASPCPAPSALPLSISTPVSVGGPPSWVWPGPQLQRLFVCRSQMGRAAGPPRWRSREADKHYKHAESRAQTAPAAAEPARDWNDARSGTMPNIQRTPLLCEMASRMANTAPSKAHWVGENSEK